MHKALLSVFLFAALASTAQAENPCQEAYDLATTIMAQRQDNEPMPNIVNYVNGSAVSGTAKKLIINIITMAYDQPRYPSDQYKAEAVKAFANDIYLSCMKE